MPTAARSRPSTTMSVTATWPAASAGAPAIPPSAAPPPHSPPNWNGAARARHAPRAPRPRRSAPIRPSRTDSGAPTGHAGDQSRDRRAPRIADGSAGAIGWGEHVSATSRRAAGVRARAQPGRQRWLPDAVEALIHVGDLTRAVRLTARLEDRVRSLGRPASFVAAARCRALVSAAHSDVEGGLEHLDGVLTRVTTVPIPLELARALIVKGQLERRRKHRRQAGQWLRQALNICERIGATLWARRATEELERLGRCGDPDALTATEAKVARLVASGLSNRQVA